MENKQFGWGLGVFVALALAAVLGGFGLFFGFNRKSSPPLTKDVNETPSSPVPTSITQSSIPSNVSSSSSAVTKKAPLFPVSNSIRTEKRLADVPNIPKGIFNYGGSTTFAPLRSQKIVAAINQAHPEFILRYTEPIGNEKPGSGTGIEMLIEGQLSFSQSSRALKDQEYQKAKDRNFTLKQIPVAIDGIAFYVNPRLISQGLKGITLAQAQDIFTGKIKNWKDAGGPDLEITAFSRNLKAGGTVDFFDEKVLAKKPLGVNVKEVRDTTDSIRKVALNPAGIGYATASEVINQQMIRLIPLSKDANSPFVSPCADSSCKSINRSNFADDSYPLTRRLFIIIRQDGELDQQAGDVYANLLLSDEGQKLVEEAGFVALRK